MTIVTGVLAGIVVELIKLKSDSFKDTKILQEIAENIQLFCDDFEKENTETVVGTKHFHSYLSHYHPIEKIIDYVILPLTPSEYTKIENIDNLTSLTIEYLNSSCQKKLRTSEKKLILDFYTKIKIIIETVRDKNLSFGERSILAAVLSNKPAGSKNMIKDDSIRNSEYDDEIKNNGVTIDETAKTEVNIDKDSDIVSVKNDSKSEGKGPTIIKWDLIDKNNNILISNYTAEIKKNKKDINTTVDLIDTSQNECFLINFFNEFNNKGELIKNHFDITCKDRTNAYACYRYSKLWNNIYESKDITLVDSKDGSLKASFIIKPDPKEEIYHRANLLLFKKIYAIEREEEITFNVPTQITIQNLELLGAIYDVITKGYGIAYMGFGTTVEKTHSIKDKELELREINHITFTPSYITLFDQKIVKNRIAITMPHFKTEDNGNIIEVKGTEYLVFSDVNKREEIDLEKIIEAEDKRLNIDV